MKRSLRTLFFAALVLSAGPVLADAPIGQYEQFVKDTPTIRDKRTLLEWERFAPRDKETFAVAGANCPSTFRLPTVKELLTLVDEQPHQDYDIALAKTVTKMIDQSAFGSYTGEDAAYWSSTPTGTANERWGVSFKDGTMVRMAESSAGYARCVK
jgi:hypothetical protein